MLITGITLTAMQSVEAHTPVPAQVTQTVAIRDGDFQKNVNLHKRLYFFKQCKFDWSAGGAVSVPSVKWSGAGGVLVLTFVSHSTK